MSWIISNICGCMYWEDEICLCLWGIQVWWGCHLHVMRTRGGGALQGIEEAKVVDK